MDVLGTCLGYVMDMLWIWYVHFMDMSALLQGQVRDLIKFMIGICQGHVLDMFWTCYGHVRYILVTCQEYILITCHSF